MARSANVSIMGLVESDSMEPVAARPPTSVHLGPPRPVHYAIKRQVVQTAWASRAVKAGAATAMLFASGRAAGASVELLQMQGAVAKQLHELGQTWVTGLSAWTRECTELRAANTMSKIVEQEFDLIGQFGQLVTDQATALVNLMEGVQVGYGYWVQEKLDR